MFKKLWLFIRRICGKPDLSNPKKRNLQNGYTLEDFDRKLKEALESYGITVTWKTKPDPPDLYHVRFIGKKNLRG